MSRGIYQSQGICIPLFTGAPVSFRPLSVQNYPINSAITSLLLSCLVERQVLVFSHCHGVASSIRNSREWVVCQECQQVSSLGCVNSKILVRDEHKFDGRGPVKIHTVVRVEFKSTRTSYTGIFTSVLLSDSRLSCVHQQYIYLNISFHCKWTNCTEKAKVKAEIDFICRNGNGLMKKKNPFLGAFEPTTDLILSNSVCDCQFLNLCSSIHVIEVCRCSFHKHLYFFWADCPLDCTLVSTARVIYVKNLLPKPLQHKPLRMLL